MASVPAASRSVSDDDITRKQTSANKKIIQLIIQLFDDFFISIPDNYRQFNQKPTIFSESVLEHANNLSIYVIPLNACFSFGFTGMNSES